MAMTTAITRMRYVTTALREDGIQPEVLLAHLDYIGEVLGVLAAKEE